MTICEFSWLDGIIYVYTFIIWYYIIGLYMDLSHYVYVLRRVLGRSPPLHKFAPVPVCNPPGILLFCVKQNIVCFLIFNKFHV